MKLFIFFILLVLFSSCTDQMDGEKAAQEYCNCMNRNKSDNYYFYASTICNAEIAKKYRFYRIFYIDTKDQEFNEKLPQSTRDSTNKFIDAFLDYRNKNNCPR